jgi:glycosyltransferase involved in cell wall biosynthesis
LTTNAYSTEAFFLGDRRRIEKSREVIDGANVERLTFKTSGRRILNFLRAVACRIPYPLGNYIRAISFGPRNRNFLRKIIQLNPDVIFGAPLPNLSVRYAFRAAKKLNKPFICIPSYHIFDPCCFYNRLFFKMMREADVLMAQSPLERDYLAAEAGVDPERVIILPPFPLKEHQLGPPVKDKKTIRERYGIVENKVVLYLGQHGKHKRVDAAVEAMPHVWKRHKDTALVIAGGKTKYTDVLKARAAELEREGGGKIYFIDNFPAQEKDDILQMADIFISLSEMESFGIVFVEALNSGAPVVASKHGVARCIIDDWETGLLVEPRLVVEVAGALVELLSDEGMRLRFSARARQKAVLLYHPERILDKWEEVLAMLQSRKSGTHYSIPE